MTRLDQDRLEEFFFFWKGCVCVCLIRTINDRLLLKISVKHRKYTDSEQQQNTAQLS